MQRLAALGARLLSVVLAALTLALAAPAGAQTFASLQSQPGDPVGGGAIRNFTNGNASFNASFSDGGVYLYLNGGPLEQWDIVFYPPRGQWLAPGEYPFAERVGLRSEVEPALEVLPRGGQTCAAITGRFTVHEYTIVQGQGLTSFAIDFEQHCNGAGPPLLGVIRYNSAVPAVPPNPVASALGTQYVEAGRTANLSGATSRDPAGSSLTYAWTQVSGPAVALSAPAAAFTSFTAPIVPAGGADLVFQLQVTNGAALSATRNVSVRVANPDDPKTVMYVKSDTGDFVGRGMEAFFLPQPNVSFLSGGPAWSSLSDGVRVDYTAGQLERLFTVFFTAPNRVPLAVGEYPLAALAPQSPGVAGLSFTGTRSCGSLTGKFTVWEYEAADNYTLQKFAADFEQHCEGGAPGLSGAVRVNSSVPLQVVKPISITKASPIAEVGEVVPLDGASSRDGDGGALTYQWSQVSGPAAAITSANAAVASFVAPAVPAGGADLVFELRVTDTAAQSATSRVTVHVFNASDPRTFVHVRSQAGDPVGLGVTRLYTNVGNTITAGTYDGGVSVDIGGGGISWSSRFLPQVGAMLLPGHYPNAERAFSRTASIPGLEVLAFGRNCTGIDGHFTVWESVVVNNTVQRFAADFEQYCDGASAPLRASVRFNSLVPLVPATPIAFARVVDTDFIAGATISLDGTRSLEPAGAALTYAWRQVSGTPVTLLSPNAAIASFVAPAPPLGGSDLVFELTVTAPGGASASAQASVHIANAADKRTFLYVQSDSGDYVGQGITRTFTPADGTFGLTVYPSSAYFTFNGGTFWRIQLISDTDLLTPGGYPNARETYPRLPGVPGLDVWGPGSNCSPITGSFVVLERTYNVAGGLESFAADFQQRCNSSVAVLRGSIRYNSAIPRVATKPVVSVTAETEVLQGESVVLDGSRSADPAGALLTYGWTQISGTPATLATPGAAIASFVAPVVPAGGSDLVFELVVTNPSGISASTRVTVHVASPVDARTFIHFRSEPGDYIGQGETRTYRPADGTFGANQDYGGVGIFFDDFNKPGSDYTWWDAEFVAPDGPLVPGVYLLAERAPFRSPVRPGLNFSGSGRGCNTLTGRFTVYESVIVNNVVERFAADFEQHCEGATPALFGKVRYRSNVPLVPDSPVASAAAPKFADEGATVTLDGTGSVDPAGTALTYSWSQVSGPPVTILAANTALASFVAPAVPLGGASLTFELVVSNTGGRTSSARATVQVVDSAAPKTFLYFESETGDYIGQGQTRLYTPNDGNFRAEPNYSNGIAIDFDGSEYWVAQFAPPQGQLLAPGDYPVATRFPFQAPTVAGLDFYGEGRGCNQQSGRFMVWEYEVVGTVLQRFAADFEQHCENGGPALRGIVRFNSTVPMRPPQPIASAIARSTVDVGETVSLDGRPSRDPNGSALTYLWTQVSGPAVAITNANAALATFVAPAVPAGGADLVFDLTVTNVPGLSMTDRVSVHVANAADPRTFMLLQSDPGDPVGQGLTRRFTPADGLFVLTPSFYGAGLDVAFDGIQSWDARFLTDAGLLTVGEYPNAIRAPFNVAGVPGLDIYGPHGSCGTIAGSFTVHEMSMVNGVVERFAVDFVQHCQSATPALRGAIRFNSSVPYPVLVDTIPVRFTFRDLDGVMPGTVATSQAATITGLGAPAAISVAGGEYSIGCTSTFTTAPATIAEGQSVCVRHTTPLALAATTVTTLTVGGYPATFRSTTRVSLPDGDYDGDGMSNAIEASEGRNPFVRDNDVLGNVRLFAMQQYRDFLGREGDAGGIQFYADRIGSGALSRAQAIENFFTSPEFSGSVSPIVRLYFATFLRIPDYPGLMYQVGVTRSGAPLEAIANNFTLSPEFVQRYGTLDNRGFVALLYQNILGRTASPGEIDYHAARLQSGVSRGAVLAGFSESPEFKQLSAIDVYVTMMYAGMLRRVPEQAGFDYWVNYMEQGNSGLALIMGFLNSPEYRNRFQ